MATTIQSQPLDCARAFFCGQRGCRRRVLLPGYKCHAHRDFAGVTRYSWEPQPTLEMFKWPPPKQPPPKQRVKRRSFVRRVVKLPPYVPIKIAPPQPRSFSIEGMVELAEKIRKLRRQLAPKQ